MDSEDPTILTPENAQVLAVIGQDILYQLQYLLPHLVLYGLYLALVISAVYTIAQRPTYSARTFLLVGALAATSCITTFNWAFLSVVHLQNFIEKILVDNTFSSMYDRADSWSAAGINRTYIVTVWVGASGLDSGLLFIIKDILVSWRALAIWGPMRHRRPLHVALSILVFLSFGFGIAYAGRKTNMTLKGIYEDELNNSTNYILLITSSCASTAANLVATSMMAFATWKHLRESAEDSMPTLRGGKVLLYLTESGVIYAVVQITRIALNVSIAPDTPRYGALNTASQIFVGITDIIVAMYTPAIILIVHYHLSIEHSIQLSTNASMPSHRAGDQTVSEICFRQSGGHGHMESIGVTSAQDRSMGEFDSSRGVTTSNSTTGSLLKTGDVTPVEREDAEKAI